MTWWVPFPASWLSDPRVRALSLAARGVLASLIVQAGGGAALPYVAGHGAEGTVALVALRQGAPADPEQAVGAELLELQRVGLLSLDDEARELLLHLSAGHAQGPARPPEPPAEAPAGQRLQPGQSSARRAERADRHYFERRERRWQSVPLGVTWEQWLGTPDGLAYASKRNTSATPPQHVCNTPLQHGAQHVCNTSATPPCNTPLHVSLKGLYSSEKTDKERGEGERAREAQHPPATRLQHGAQHPPATPPRNTSATPPRCAEGEEPPALDALDVLGALAQSSGGRIDVRCTSTVQAAFVRAVRDVGYTLDELHALGKAARHPVRLWPWAAEKLAGRAKVTLPFLLGKRSAEGTYEATPLTDAMAILRAMPPDEAPAPPPAAPQGILVKALPPEELAEEARRKRPRFNGGAS